MSVYGAIITEIALPAYNGLTDAQILVALNAKSVVTPVPAKIPHADIVNAFDATELLGLATNEFAALDIVLNGDIIDVTQPSTARALLLEIFENSGTPRPTSLGKLAALVQSYDGATVPWWKQFGSVPLTENELVAARAGQ